MSKQSIIDNLESELRKYKNYAADLEIRHNKAVNALAELARGFGRDYSGRAGGWDQAMRKLAGDELAAIAKLSLRKPYG